MHKLAFDWASGRLDYFDAVFVLKLRFAENESIPSMLVEQILSLKDEDVSPQKLQTYLKSGNERVLLALDGLDEIELEKYPKIKEIIMGAEYRKCTILFTTRPYVTKSHSKKQMLDLCVFYT